MHNRPVHRLDDECSQVIVFGMRMGNFVSWGISVYCNLPHSKLGLHRKNEAKRLVKRGYSRLKARLHMQFLSQRRWSFKIARVNHSAISARY